MHFSNQRSTPSQSLLSVGKRQTGIWVSNGPGRKIRGLEREQGEFCGGLPARFRALTKHADGAPSELDLSTEPQFGPRSGPTACRNSRRAVPWGGLCAFIAHYVRGHRLTRKYNFAQRISIASP